MHELTLLIFFLYGLVFGSFFNVVGLRIPTQTLFNQKRSYCDTCQRTLSWSELVPVWSYVFQKGRCRNCRESISPIYPVIEVMTGLLFAFSYSQFGWTQQTVMALLLISLILPVTVSDIVYKRIPNKLLLFFSPIFIIYRLIYPLTTFWDSLAGTAFAFALVLMIIILSKGGMGMGDLKYYTLFGFVFGFAHFLLLFFLSTLYGALSGVVVMKVKKLGRKAKIPFGPSIGLAALTVYFFGDTLIHWYLTLFM